jgi:hypothetical protein
VVKINKFLPPLSSFFGNIFEDTFLNAYNEQVKDVKQVEKIFSIKVNL